MEEKKSEKQIQKDDMAWDMLQAVGDIAGSNRYPNASFEDFLIAFADTIYLLYCVNSGRIEEIKVDDRLYLAVQSPEVQKYMERSDFKEKSFYDATKDMYFIPKDWIRDELQ